MSNFPSEPEDSRYVLRLIVVKVEGVLLPPPEDWQTFPELTSFDADNLFPEWSRELDIQEPKLRTRLAETASSQKLPIQDDLRDFLDEIKNHTPVRVAFLSSGPSEWVTSLEESYELADLNDLIFCYDNYTHGTRRTLLQFLMNRFIAGKGRTMLLGNTLDDERIADREETRFRSFSDPPDSSSTPERWNWSLSRLRNYVHEIKAED